jgi:hypothetical protein
MYRCGMKTRWESRMDLNRDAEFKDTKRTSRAILLAFLGTIASVFVFMLFFGRFKGSYTLYRDSPTDKSARLHIATFDATDG